MKPYIVSAREIAANTLRVVISAETSEEATAFARNYFGDSRADIRNRNYVAHTGTETFGTETHYIFEAQLG